MWLLCLNIRRLLHSSRGETRNNRMPKTVSNQFRNKKTILDNFRISHTCSRLPISQIKPRLAKSLVHKEIEKKYGTINRQLKMKTWLSYIPGARMTSIKTLTTQLNRKRKSKKDTIKTSDPNTCLSCYLPNPAKNQTFLPQIKLAPWPQKPKTSKSVPPSSRRYKARATSAK